MEALSILRSLLPRRLREVLSLLCAMVALAVLHFAPNFAERQIMGWVKNKSAELTKTFERALAPVFAQPADERDGEKGENG